VVRLRGVVSLSGAQGAGATLGSIPQAPAQAASYATVCTLAGYTAGHATVAAQAGSANLLLESAGNGGNTVTLDGIVIPLD
jgi:hypothetical protein